MSKLRIGLVDLDTSHPGAFVPIIRSHGHEVAAVFDGGGVNPPGYAAAFAQEHAISNACDTLEAMIPLVDAVFIHSCNWDRHIARARPFMEAGKAVFIDKPIAGNMRDLEQVRRWAASGAKIIGGSALRFCPRVREWQDMQIAKPDWIYAIAGCGVDEFNYGIHAYAMLAALGGPGIASVRHLGAASLQQQYELQWEDGRRGAVSAGPANAYLPFYATVATQERVDYIQSDNQLLYEALLGAILPYFADEAANPLANPLPLPALVEAEAAAIAACYSLETGQPARLQDVPATYAGYDGAAFEAAYRALKYPPEPGSA